MESGHRMLSWLRILLCKEDRAEIRRQRGIRNPFTEKIGHWTHKNISFLFPDFRPWFLSVEPLHEDLGEMDPDAQKPEWIIVGAETGRRNGKVVPEPGWIEKIRFQCAKYPHPLSVRLFLCHTSSEAFPLLSVRLWLSLTYRVMIPFRFPFRTHKNYCKPDIHDLLFAID